MFRVREHREFHHELPLLSNHLTIRDHRGRFHLMQIIYQQNVCTFPWRNRTQIMLLLKIARHIQRHHLDRCHRRDALFDRAPSHMIEMPFLHQRLRIHVIGNKRYIGRIHAILGHNLDDLFDIMPRRAFSNHEMHAHANLLQTLFPSHRFVIRRYSRCDVGLQHAIIFTREMPRNRLPTLQRCFNFSAHFGIPVHDAGEIHHFTQSDHVVPLQSLLNIDYFERSAGIFQIIRCGYAGRECRKHFKRQPLPLFMHQTNPFSTKHIRNLMRVHENPRRPFDDRCLGKFRDGQHRTLNVHMAVQQARHHIFPSGIYHFRLCSDGMICFPYVGNASCRNGNIHMCEKFT
ncbi:hypothetical protein D3C85_1002420 [compost metagenome]